MDPRAEIDHLVVVVDDLERGMRWWADATGVTAEPGGSHPGRGTRNALCSLGPGRYVELLAPDPAQGDDAGIAWVPGGGHGHPMPRLATWCIRTEDLDAITPARTHGVAYGDPVEMSRARPGGPDLRWRLRFPVDDHGGTVPFAIDWGSTPHPSGDRGELELERLVVTGPDPEPAARLVEELGIVDVETASAAATRLSMVLGTPLGRRELG